MGSYHVFGEKNDFLGKTLITNKSGWVSHFSSCFIIDIFGYIFFLVRPGTLWLSLAPFGRHLVSLWLSFGRPLAFLRLPGAAGCSLGAPSDVVYNLVSTFRANLTFRTRLHTRSSLSEFARQPRQPRQPRQAPGNGVKNRPSGPISTRAGGQDDVS